MLRIPHAHSVWKDVLDLCYTDAWTGGFQVSYSEAMGMEWDEFRYCLNRARSHREKVHNRMKG